ncbi:hypothetical protein I350_01013 [Cryptococcus amylolentus CBS 6273]|uniref:Uncharacterized protein n=1 Tax=Cryptococcus amylolentus CBS 6273 TaxID=1296118 RepID=A0A1E3KBC5_9TREE|nr:hypothetical protein I350_01013 [Cryptococcus amylolentus CBS 6273]
MNVTQEEMTYLASQGIDYIDGKGECYRVAQSDVRTLYGFDRTSRAEAKAYEESKQSSGRGQSQAQSTHSDPQANAGPSSGDIWSAIEFMTPEQQLDYYTTMNAEDLESLGYGTTPTDGTMGYQQPASGYNEELDENSALAQASGDAFYESLQRQSSRRDR